MSFYYGATLGPRVKQFLARIPIERLQNQLCGFEMDTYEAKVAVSFYLSFCEEKLHNLQFSPLISSSYLTNASIELTKASGSLRGSQRTVYP